MPTAPVPMNAYACLHDPIVHAKSDHDASEVSSRRRRRSALCRHQPRGVVARVLESGGESHALATVGLRCTRRPRRSSALGEVSFLSR